MHQQFQLNNVFLNEQIGFHHIFQRYQLCVLSLCNPTSWDIWVFLGYFSGLLRSRAFIIVCWRSSSKFCEVWYGSWTDYVKIRTTKMWKFLCFFILSLTLKTRFKVCWMDHVENIFPPKFHQEVCEEMHTLDF